MEGCCSLSAARRTKSEAAIEKVEKNREIIQTLRATNGEGERMSAGRTTKSTDTDDKVSKWLLSLLWWPDR